MKQKLLFLNLVKESLISTSKIDLNHIDQEEFYMFLREQKLIDTISSKFNFTDIGILQKIKDDNITLSQKTSIIKKEVEKIFSETIKQEIPMVLIKGFVLSQLIYGDETKRSYGDVDLLVQEHNMAKIDKILRNFGYVQFNDFSPNYVLNKPLLKNADEHEYFPYRKIIGDTRIYVEVAKNLHKTVKGNGIDRLLCEHIDYYGSDMIKTLTIENSLIQTIENVYNNSFDSWNIVTANTNLRDYIDLFYLIKKCGISPYRILKLVTDFNMANEAYCAINDLFNLFPQDEEIRKIFDQFYLYEHCNSNRHVLLDKMMKAERSGLRFSQKIKEDMYGLKNPQYFLNNNHFCRVLTPEADVFVEYRVSNNCEKFVIELLPSKVLVDNFDEYLLHIQIVNNNLKSTKTTHTTEIFGEKSLLYFYSIDCDYRLHEDRHIKNGEMHANKQLLMIDSNGKLCLEVVPMEFVMTATDNRIVANLSVLKKMDEKIYHKVDDNNDFHFFIDKR